MKSVLVIVVSFAALLGCAPYVSTIEGTPTAGQVLANARSVAGELEAYEATRTFTETTVHTGNPSSDSSVSHQQFARVQSRDAYSIEDPDFGFGYIRSGMRAYSRNAAGEWELSAYKGPADDMLFPGPETTLPPLHPLEWLDQRTLKDAEYTDTGEIDGRPVYVVAGRVSLLSASLSDEHGIPSDNVRIYIDTESFNVLRIEIDHNLLDSQREDVGYQVIPGIVDIHTVETVEYSNHNGMIEIALPELSRPVR
jgi:hypothetical protein